MILILKNHGIMGCHNPKKKKKIDVLLSYKYIHYSREKNKMKYYIIYKKNKHTLKNSLSLRISKDLVS